MSALYVSYTPAPVALPRGARAALGFACSGGEADGRTRTGDPFITSEALTPHAGPPEGTTGPSRLPFARAAEGPACPVVDIAEGRRIRLVYAGRRGGLENRCSGNPATEGSPSLGNRDATGDPDPTAHRESREGHVASERHRLAQIRAFVHTAVHMGGRAAAPGAPSLNALRSHSTTRGAGRAPEVHPAQLSLEAA